VRNCNSRICCRSLPWRCRCYFSETEPCCHVRSTWGSRCVSREEREREWGRARDLLALCTHDSVQDIVGYVSVMIADPEGRWMREYHGGSRHREYFPHNVVRDVGQVDQHPNSVHLVDDCLSIITKCMITTGRAGVWILIEDYSIIFSHTEPSARLFSVYWTIWEPFGFSEAIFKRA